MHLPIVKLKKGGRALLIGTVGPKLILQTVHGPAVYDREEIE